MSGNLAGFDASKVEPNQGFTPIPAGDYPAVVIDSKMKPTKAGTGQYLELQLQILNGKFQNRRLFDRLNLQNPNAQAVQIAKGTLSAICRAINVLTPNDSSELHNKPLTISVKVKNDNQGNPQNEISGYKPRQTSAPSQQPNMVEQAFETVPGDDDKRSPF